MKGSLYSPRVRGRGFDARSAFFFFWCAVFSELFLLGTVCALTKEYLDLIDCNYATELYAAVRRTSMHMYIPAMFLPLLLLCVLLSAVVAAAAAACCRCCSSSCARWQNLLLWFVASDSSDLFLFVVQARLFFMYVSLGNTVAFAASIYLYFVSYMIENGHVRSQGWRQPAATKPPLYFSQ